MAAQQEVGKIMADKSSDQKGKQPKRDSDQKVGKPNWISVIESNPDDITRYMWDLFQDLELKTNIEEDLKKDKKSLE